MSSPSEGRSLGSVLVAVQGLLFLAVGLTALLGEPWVRGSWWAGTTLMLLGLLGMFWSAKDLGRALTPMPTPNGAGLAAGGIYAHVRHPMYTSMVAVALGLAIGSGRLWTYVTVIALAVFFEVKSRVEERYLVGAYPGYAEYAARTGKYVPGLGRRAGV